MGANGKWAYAKAMSTDDNILKLSGASISSSTENSNFPDGNVVEMPLSKPWKTTSDTSQWIEVDAGATQSGVVICVLAGLNYTSGVTIDVKMGNSANPTTETDTHTWNPLGGKRIQTIKLTPGSDYRYFRINISDPSNPDGVLVTGFVYIGQLKFPTKAGGDKLSFSSEGFARDHMYPNSMHDPEYGSPQVQGFNKRHELDWPFVGLDFTAYSAMIQDFDEQPGDANPMIFINDHTKDAENHEAYFARVRRLEDNYLPGSDTYDLRVLAKEEGTGRRLS